MNGASAIAAEPWVTGNEPPRLDLSPFSPGELYEWFRGGELEADLCEELLAWAARARGAIDVGIAEGLNALRKGDRLAELGCHLDDYAREVLDLGKRAAQELARLGRELPARPLLREALRSGRVRLRAAETLLRTPAGEEEAAWVERASRMTVRELEAAVRCAGAAPEEDEEWVRLGARLRPEEREVVDEALALAGEVLPGACRLERLEAIAQEFAAEFPIDPDLDPGPALRGELRPLGPGARQDPRAAALEAETDRWSFLPGVGEVPVPDVRFYETATAHDIDGKLRQLARLRSGWDDIVTWCASAVRQSRMYERLGFADFRQYCEERLGLPARAIEQRTKVEERRWTSPALREAKDRGLPFEKLRLLSRLPEGDIARWTPRAEALTCVALRRELEAESERQMRARRKLLVPLPLRVVAVVAAAVQAIRERLGPLPLGECLALMAQHFVETWRGAVKGGRSRSRKVRDRGGGMCQVPGCSRRATHSHHVMFRSHGGGDDLENQIGVCAFHHLRCIHGGWLRVVGRAPDALRWFLAGEPWDGPRATPPSLRPEAAVH